jgi:hypothetical protein
MPIETRRPNLFLVGAQKSGTTTLALMLDQHPKISMSQPKEPGYLAFGTAGYTALDGYGRVVNAASWVVRTEQAYLALFRSAPENASFLGEASTWYLSEPGMPERLHDFNPQAHVVAILRQPADRAYSAWCHARRDREEPHEQFAQALAAEPARKNASHLLRYREMSRYLKPLEQYIERFGKDHVHIMFYEDLRDDPDSLWLSCCKFLGLTSERTPAAYQQNRSGLPRSRLIHSMLRSKRVKRCMRRVLPLRFTAWAKHRLATSNLRRLPPLPAAQRNALSREFIEETKALMALTGRDLTHWLPDD